MKKFLYWLYWKKKITISIIPIGFTILLVLSFIWIFFPNANLEPLIVLVGFLVTIMQNIPAAIAYAYPTVKYKFSGEIVYGGVYRNDDFSHIAAVKNVEDDALKSIEKPDILLSLKNLSENIVEVKSISLGTLSVSTFISKGGKSIAKIYPNESSVFPMALFLNQKESTLSEQDFLTVNLGDGSKVSLLSPSVKDLIEAKNKLYDKMHNKS